MERCLEVGIETEVWNCEISEGKRCNIERDLRSGEPSLKLLYTTPESLKTPRLQQALQVLVTPSLPVHFLEHASGICTDDKHLHMS